VPKSSSRAAVTVTTSATPKRFRSPSSGGARDLLISSERCRCFASRLNSAIGLVSELKKVDQVLDSSRVRAYAPVCALNLIRSEQKIYRACKNNRLRPSYRLAHRYSWGGEFEASSVVITCQWLRFSSARLRLQPGAPKQSVEGRKCASNIGTA
jgi:hypothetical protein